MHLCVPACMCLCVVYVRESKHVFMMCYDVYDLHDSEVAMVVCCTCVACVCLESCIHVMFSC